MKNKDNIELLGKSVDDALKRAEAYSAAGADAILIHSKDKNPDKIFTFSKNFSNISVKSISS